MCESANVYVKVVVGKVTSMHHCVRWSRILHRVVVCRYRESVIDVCEIRHFRMPVILQRARVE